MNKRGDVNWFLISLIMALIILASTGFFSGKLFAATAGTIDSVTASDIKAAATACRAQSTISGVTDMDKDKLADFCDPCVDGSDDQQSDADGVADKCDVAATIPDKSPFIACCGDTQRKGLEDALTAYDKADTQKGKLDALAQVNKNCANGHTIRTVKPFQCMSNSIA